MPCRRGVCSASSIGHCLLPRSDRPAGWRQQSRTSHCWRSQSGPTSFDQSRSDMWHSFRHWTRFAARRRAMGRPAPTRVLQVATRPKRSRACKSENGARKYSIMVPTRVQMRVAFMVTETSLRRAQRSNPESHTATNWIASSLMLLAMTVNCFPDSAWR